MLCKLFVGKHASLPAGINERRLVRDVNNYILDDAKSGGDRSVVGGCITRACSVEDDHVSWKKAAFVGPRYIHFADCISAWSVLYKIFGGFGIQDGVGEQLRVIFWIYWNYELACLT